MSRALRIRHAERLKKNRKVYWGGSKKDAKTLGKLVHTAAVCSCWMCCNPRKHGFLSIQERRADQDIGI